MDEVDATQLYTASVRRRDLIARTRGYFIGRSLVWITVIAAGVLVGSTVLVAQWPTCSEQHPRTRIAIRVDCRDPSKCALAEALALDVWSEQRGAEIPLDVVVAADALP